MKSFRTNRIIFAAGAMLIGIILLVWPSTSLLIMGKCVGAFLALGGLAAAFMFFRDHESATRSLLLVMAAVMLICGIVIFLHPQDLVKLIPTIMGILVMISGLINLGETFVLTRNKYGKWWISLIVSIVTIAAGIFLVRNAFNLASLITRIAGGILVFDGISDLWVVSRLSKSASLKEEAAAFSGASVTETASDQAGEKEANESAATQAAPIVPAGEAPAQEGPGESTADIAPSPEADVQENEPVYMNQTEQESDFAAFSETDGDSLPPAESGNEKPVE